MEIFSDTKIYMVCPSNFHSGGPELCHQLVSQLLQFELDAYIYYLPRTGGKLNLSNPVDEFYIKYHCPYVFQIEDKPQNILIINESSNWMYYEFKNVRKIFWWMSVDNYLSNLSHLLSVHKQNALSVPLPKIFYFQKDDTEHWVQSEYARQFVLLNGVPAEKVFFVEDYLNQAFLSRADTVNFSAKQDIVAFNPKKGFEVTQELTKIAPDIKWVPIYQMTPEQVQALLAASKVYIDFGDHPGKDRIPREAALSGCVVITGKRGAAANDIDINIPAEFKFGETEKDFPLIIEKIREVFKNFGLNYLKQGAYHERILDDKPRFSREVAEAFNLQSRQKIPSAAILQGYGSQSYQLLQIFSEGKIPAVPKFIVDDKLGKGENFALKFITHKQNHNYFNFVSENPNGGGYKIPFITFEDAKFLYAEGRINKFVLLKPTDAEINFFAKNLSFAQNDILIVNF